MCVFRSLHIVFVQLSGPPSDWFYDVTLDDQSAVLSRPSTFVDPCHARAQLPPLTTAPASPPVDSEQTHEEPPNKVPLAEGLQRVLEQLRVKREQEDQGREDAGGGSGDMSENEDGILLIPEGETGGRVRVQSSCHRHLIAVALDEELSEWEWKLPGHFPPGQQSSLLLQVWSLFYTHLLLI